MDLNSNFLGSSLTIFLFSIKNYKIAYVGWNQIVKSVFWRSLQVSFKIYFRVHVIKNYKKNDEFDK